MNHNGTLILHANPQLAYTSDQNDYCGQAGLAACSLAVSTVPYDGTTRVFHVVAAFPDTSQPRLKALAWGVAYDQAKVVIAAHGPCGTGEFDIRDAGWPGNGTGIGQSWTSTRTSILNEIYWFAGYAYGAADTTSLRLTPHPVQGGLFVDDSAPPAEDLITGYGWMGFGVGGSLPCPGGTLPGGDGPEGGGIEGGDVPEEPDSEGEIEGEGDGADEGSYPGGREDAPPELRTNRVSLSIEHDAIGLTSRDGTPRSITEIPRLNPDLRLALEATGARSLAPTFPGVEPGTTEAPDYRGRLVTVPDLSRFYTVEFASYESARDAVSVLSTTPGVRSADVITNQQVMSTPTDEYFHIFPAWPAECPQYACLVDPQWHLRNRGLRPGTSGCSDAASGQDINADTYPWWPLPSGPAPYTMLGVIDTGIGFGSTPDLHEDLDLVSLTPQQRLIFRRHPNSAWCIPHGTVMAGLAAARTNNDGLGVAGVCAGARVLNMECSACSQDDCDDNVEATCGLLETGCFLQTAVAACDHFLGDGLRTILISSAAWSLNDTLLYPAPSYVSALWTAYVRGVNLVAPSANTTYDSPRRVLPASIPFVIGVGGHVHDGRFWEPHSSCYSEGSKGTTIGPGLDICGPASPHAVSTIPFLLPNPKPPYYIAPEELGPYWYTTMQCSGASAVAAGSVAYLHGLSAALCDNRYAPNQDDVQGLLLSTTRDFTEDPLLYSACQTCKRTDYGRGMVDLERASRALMAGFCWEGGFSPYLHPEVVAWGDPRLRMDLVQEITWGGEVWREYLVTATLWIPPTYMEDLPGRIAWANPVGNASEDQTTTRGGYGPNNNDAVKWQRVRNAGIFSYCELTWPDEHGQAVLYGYNYEKVSPTHEWMVDPEELQMAFTYISDPSGVDPAHVEDRTGSAVTAGPAAILSVAHRQSGVVLEVRWPAEGDLRVGIADVQGRIVTTLHRPKAGAGNHEVFWDGRTDAGALAPSGVYWALLEAERGVSRKFVVVH